MPALQDAALAQESPHASRAERPSCAAGAGFAWFVLSVTMLLFAAGCQKPLFPIDAPRSQYDRIDTIRDRRAPAYYFDEFGTRRPNLRGRLLTSE